MKHAMNQLDPQTTTAAIDRPRPRLDDASTAARIEPWPSSTTARRCLPGNVMQWECVITSVMRRRGVAT